MYARVSGRTRLFVVLVLQVVLIIGSTGVVAAGTQGTNCSSDTSKVLLYENGIGDTGDNDDRFWRCADTQLLSAFNHTLPGDCKGALFGSTTWNDCVSSYQIWIPTGWHLTFYKDADYNNWYVCYIGPRNGDRVNVVSGANDTLTSFRWIHTETCP